MGVESSLPLLPLYCIVYGVIAILPLLLLKRAPEERDTLNPYIVTSLLVFFYIFSTLRSFETGGNVQSIPGVSETSIVKFGVVCLIGQIGLTCGEISALLRPRSLLPPQQDRSDRVRIAFLTGPGLLVALAALPFYFQRFNFLDVASYAETAFASRVSRNLDESMGPVDVFLREIPLSVLLCASTIFVFDVQRSLFVRIAGAFVIFSYAVTALLGGSRGDLASTLLLPLMYYHYRVRKLSAFVVLFTSAVGYLIMNALEIARLSSNPLEMFDLLVEQFGLEGLAFLDVTRFGELQTSLNLVRIITGIESGIDDFRWGVVTLFNILSTVPRTIWPDRPPTGGELYAEVFFPGALEAGQGFGSFLYQDPFWDFGYPGVFVFSFVLAFALRRLHSQLVIVRGTPFWLLVYAIVFNFLVIQVVRGGIFAGLKGMLVSLAPLLLIAMLARLSAAPEEPPWDNEDHPTEQS